jgi:hypothetical protein
MKKEACRRTKAGFGNPDITGMTATTMSGLAEPGLNPRILMQPGSLGTGRTAAASTSGSKATGGKQQVAAKSEHKQEAAEPRRFLLSFYLA